MIGVYAIICGVDGRLYIGSSVQQAKHRISAHVGQLNRNKHKNSNLQEAWNRYGYKNFSWRILEFIADERLLKDTAKLQKYLLEHEQAWLNKTPKELLFNIYTETCKGKSMPASTRMKLSIPNKGQGLGRTLSPEVRAKMSASRTGKALSSEQCAAISAARKGMKFSPEHRANLSAAQKRRYAKLGEPS